MSWQTIREKGGNSSEGGKQTYVKFPIGTVQGRVMDDEPVSRWTHWIPQANGGKGISVTCIEKGCPICAAIKADKEAKRKSMYTSSKSHAINFYTRSIKENGVVTPINEMQVLDKGNQIFEGLLAILEQYGDLKSLDVMITRTGKDKNEVKYTVLPVFPPTPLTDAEKALEKIDLNELTKALTAEQIKMYMQGKTTDEIIGNAAEVPKATSANPTENLSVDFTQQA
jgi:hypothetical protein